MISFIHGPGETLSYKFDWIRYVQSDSIVNSTWEVENNDSTLTIQSTDFDSKSTIVFLSGGVSGAAYKIQNTITLASGVTAVRHIMIYCRDK